MPDKTDRKQDTDIPHSEAQELLPDAHNCIEEFRKKVKPTVGNPLISDLFLYRIEDQNPEEQPNKLINALIPIEPPKGLNKVTDEYITQFLNQYALTEDEKKSLKDDIGSTLQDWMMKNVRRNIAYVKNHLYIQSFFSSNEAAQENKITPNQLFEYVEEYQEKANTKFLKVLEELDPAIERLSPDIIDAMTEQQIETLEDFKRILANYSFKVPQTRKFYEDLYNEKVEKYQKKANTKFLESLKELDPTIEKLSPDFIHVMTEQQIKTSEDFKRILAIYSFKVPQMRKFYEDLYSDTQDKAFLDLLGKLGFWDKEHKIKGNDQVILHSWSSKVNSGFRYLEYVLTILDQMCKENNITIKDPIDKTDWNSLVDLNPLELLSVITQKTFVNYDDQQKYFAQLVAFFAYLLNLIKRYEPSVKAESAWKGLNEYVLGVDAPKDKVKRSLDIVTNKKTGDIYFECDLTDEQKENIEFLEDKEVLKLFKCDFQDRNNQSQSLECHFVGKNKKELLVIMQKLIGRSNIHSIEELSDLARAKIMVNFTHDEIVNDPSLREKIYDMARFKVGEEYLGLEYTKKKKVEELKRGEFLISDKLDPEHTDRKYYVMKVYGKDYYEVPIEVQIITRDSYILERNVDAPESHDTYNIERTMNFIEQIFPKSLFPDIHRRVVEVREVLKKKKEKFDKRYWTGEFNE